MHPFQAAHQNESRESLKKFLNAWSVATAPTQFCGKCGSLLAYLQTQFWLLGEDQGWNIQLPYCPQCNPIMVSGTTLAA
jgi:hypothetical protein